jgi:hypothetical protein
VRELSEFQNAPLDYGRERRWLSRKWALRLICAAILIVIGVIAAPYGRSFYQQAYNRFWWERCAEYTPGPGYVIIEGGNTPPEGYRPGEWFVLKAETKLWLRKPPDCWTKLGESGLFVSRPQPAAIVFLHLLKGPNGREVLVCVTRPANLPGTVGALGQGEIFILDPAAPPARRLTRSTLTLLNATDLLTDQPNAMAASLSPVRIHAGTIDPVDASRFTMRYSSAGESGVIEGQLSELSTPYRGKTLVAPHVVLSVIDGPGAKRPNGNRREAN